MHRFDVLCQVDKKSRIILGAIVHICLFFSIAMPLFIATNKIDNEESGLLPLKASMEKGFDWKSWHSV